MVTKKEVPTTDAFGLTQKEIDEALDEPMNLMSSLTKTPKGGNKLHSWADADVLFPKTSPKFRKPESRPPSREGEDGVLPAIQGSSPEPEPETFIKPRPCSRGSDSDTDVESVGVLTATSDFGAGSLRPIDTSSPSSPGSVMESQSVGVRTPNYNNSPALSTRSLRSEKGTRATGTFRTPYLSRGRSLRRSEGEGEFDAITPAPVSATYGASLNNLNTPSRPKGTPRSYKRSPANRRASISYFFSKSYQQTK